MTSTTHDPPRWDVSSSLSEAEQPRLLPRGWRPVSVMRFPLSGIGCSAQAILYAPGRYQRVDGLRVISSVIVSSDHGAWLHVSCSREDCLPSYDDVRDVKRVFIGAHRVAVEVHAPDAEHININPMVRHLWARLDARATPDFRTPAPNGGWQI